VLVYRCKVVGWLVDNIWHKVDDGSSTLFSRDSWLEGETLNTRFSRLYELIDNKLAIVADMHSLGWG